MPRARRFLIGLAGLALAAGPARSDPATDSGWSFQAVPYVWLFFLDGELGAADQTANVDANFTDLFNQSSTAGFEGNFQLSKDGWTFLVDPTYIKVESPIRLGRGPIEVKGKSDAQVTLLDVMGMREVARWPLGEPIVEAGMKQRAATVDVLAGARITVMDMGFNAKTNTPGPIFDEVSHDLEETKVWADPVFGLRGIYDVTDRLHLVARGDVGGFTIQSQVTSELWASLIYDFHPFGLDTMAVLGFRALYDDYTHNDFLYKTWLYGPVIGYGIRF
jgi:hypothetical protein